MQVRTLKTLLPARAAAANEHSPPHLATGNPLGKHPGTITINPTPGNTPRPRARTKTSLSITGESYSPTNRSFLARKSSGPLSHYALEVARLKAPPANTATSAGTRVLVCEQCKVLGVCFTEVPAFSAAKRLFCPGSNCTCQHLLQNIQQTNPALWFPGFRVLFDSNSMRNKKKSFRNGLSQMNSRPKWSFYQTCCSVISVPKLEEWAREKRQPNKAADLILSKCHDDTRSSGKHRFNSPVST